MEKTNIKTLFVDFDGTTFYHATQTIIPGTKEKFKEWKEKGYTIIITTARQVDAEEITVKALQDNELEYDGIIFGLSNGDRVVINDIKEGRDRAFGINVERDGGISHLNI